MAKNLLGNGTTEGQCLLSGIWIVRIIFHEKIDEDHCENYEKKRRSDETSRRGTR